MKRKTATNSLKTCFKVLECWGESLSIFYRKASLDKSFKDDGKMFIVEIWRSGHLTFDRTAENDLKQNASLAGLALGLYEFQYLTIFVDQRSQGRSPATGIMSALAHRLTATLASGGTSRLFTRPGSGRLRVPVTGQK